MLLSAGASPVAITSSYISSRPAGGTLFAIGGPAAQAYPAGVAIVGVDRYDTGGQVAARFFPGPGTVGLASGTNFPDALAGGAHVARFSGPMLLTDPTTLSPQTQAYLSVKAPGIAGGFLYGGTTCGQRLGAARGAGGDRRLGELTCPPRGDCSAPTRAGSLEPHVEEPSPLAARPRGGVGAHVRGLQ